MSGPGMRAVLRREGFEANAPRALAATGLLGDRASHTLHAGLANGGVALTAAKPPERAAIEQLARGGLVAFRDSEDVATLLPVAEGFALGPEDPLAEAERWKLSKFQYVQSEGGEAVARSALGLAMVQIHDPAALALMGRFSVATTPAEALDKGDLGNRGAGFLGLLACAGILLPCDGEGRTADETDDQRRMWDFHELVYHSRSRLGRSGFRVGATWEFRDDIPQPPILRDSPWRDNGVLPLYRPTVLSRDMPLFEAMETRRSVRAYSPAPITAWELGEFLYRTMRVRAHVKSGDYEVASRPYPNGGGIYEQELYVTVEACADLPRGFYHYDPVAHALCPISPPDADMSMLIEEAVSATAGLGRPQILFTIASRFGGFNWKYSAMCYAAQLKNVGAIYQTMYLVATAMGLGACGLGLGNADRFARMTGHDYATEGSIGEFMIGRPL